MTGKQIRRVKCLNEIRFRVFDLVSRKKLGSGENARNQAFDVQAFRSFYCHIFKFLRSVGDVL